MDVTTVKAKYITISTIATLACVVSLFIYSYSKEEILHKHILTLTIVRHAESYQNLSKQENMPENLDALTDTGKEQARQLADLFRNHSFDLWISSPTGRTMETRDIVYAENKAKGEITESNILSSTKKGFDENGNPITWQWREKNWSEGNDLRPENGESLTDTQNRIVEKINDWTKNQKYKNIIIFTHSDVFAALIGHIKKTPITKTYDEHAPSLAGHVLIQVYENNVWKIVE